MFPSSCFSFTYQTKKSNLSIVVSYSGLSAIFADSSDLFLSAIRNHIYLNAEIKIEFGEMNISLRKTNRSEISERATYRKRGCFSFDEKFPLH